ncbi:MAG TPA: hypothetical protein VED59_02420 [Acidimicrobiales bacterium]|nr:hypothetical protein [Acidimicrobiales bacterium]
MIRARFTPCRACERNGNVGFSGPPECDLHVVPGPNGSCAHFTTERPEGRAAPVPQVAIERASLAGVLPLLERVAARSRFAGDRPVIVGVGPDSLVLRAVDGEIDLRITQGVRGPMQRTVVAWEALNAAAGDEVTAGRGGDVPPMVLVCRDDRTLAVGDHVLSGCDPGLRLPAPHDAEVPGAQGWEVPPLGGTCTYLARAMTDTAPPALRYALLELPHFTFVTTDRHRLHVQYTHAQRAEAPVEHSLLLTQAQLSLLWEAGLEDKRLAVTAQGCRICGTWKGFQVEMDFTTGTGPFPPWRDLLAGYVAPIAVPIDAVRGRLERGGTLCELSETPGGIRLQKDYVRDALTGWVDREVTIYAKAPGSPVILEGSDRIAVIMSATEGPPAVGSAIQQVATTVAKRAKTAAGQPAAPGAAGPSVGHYTIGQEVATPTGNVKVLKDRVAYLVQLPTGRKRWFSDAGLTRFIAGQPGTEEAQEEPAA